MWRTSFWARNWARAATIRPAMTRAGVTKKSAETFFTGLKAAQVRRVVDVRLNNVSQLAGFTKREDLRYFTNAICGIEYVHLPQLAPTAEILDPYKKAKHGDWDAYE